ncbi:BadF/BadG/BcrA/BcrD ATPase family protein [Paenibacillus sp. JCM 10914]|uniref:N-acetylglucosamine kinase n=1 Tax=Paenibacillus sp. JCM 10914 TaxID=1236974 RepID=UPI0003CC6D2C|nr:BadF/BadG/BcrA/BcrD ATPase family protein [Paenibacillus sp. JCM 10914]GAE06386.1 N-acetylglucosamine kinase of eukaryotic type [Paenibacillus sp. JCM 10914]
MSLYLGVDAGGSKTHAVICDEQGNIRGKGASGNGNHQIHLEHAARNIEEACNAALQQAGVVKEDITYAYFGLAGADREADYEILRPMIKGLGYPRHDIACDTIIGMRAGTSRPYGAALICGTGFNSAARNQAGEELQYGGFGFLYGDGHAGGSGFATLAFRAVIRAWDERGPATLLTSLVLEQMGYSEVEPMYEDVLYGKISVPPTLVKTLFQAAEAGDEVATRILEIEGEELANAVCTLIRRLDMSTDAFDIVYIGSVLNRPNSSILTDAIERVVAVQAPQATCVKLTSDPVSGALLCAMDMDGAAIDPDTEAKLKAFTFEEVTAS